MSEIKVTTNSNAVEHNFLKGYTDPEGNLHTTFTVRAMTGRDEELIASKKEKNQAKILTDLLSRCITSIGELTQASVGGMAKWSEIIRSLTVGDCDYAMLKIREESLGAEITFTNNCPHCGEDLKTTALVEEFEIKEYSGYETVPCELPRGIVDPNGNSHTDGKVRYVTQADREALDQYTRTNPAKAKTLLISRCFSFNDGFPVTADTIMNLTTMDRNHIMSIIEENAFGVNPNLELTCSACGESFIAKLDTSNFM